ncbi:hypothetical protein H2200_003670 [Cladophialophora chaetospira]|uniref:Uncharacterized protein n=1 Tax=Cladophialophora chaetospira TaxID=386627 RepID=A0AA38XEM4_9EURO|nr:hypothetical protein H2200_003670 [Cladophialophora chaetospira]
MALKSVSMSSFSSLSLRGSSDSRKASRESRARPWMTGSVLRGRSAAVGGQVRQDAPSLPPTATAPLVPSPVPSATVVRGPVKQSASKIPVLVRRCGTSSVGKEVAARKVEPPPKSSVVAEMTPPAPRIPVRSKVSPVVYRPVPAQVRNSRPLAKSPGLPVGKEGGKRSLPPPVPLVPLVRPPPGPEEMSIQRCINPKSIRTHRDGLRAKPILKLRMKPSDDTDPHRPSLQPVSAVRKKVQWAEELTVPTAPRPWPSETYYPSAKRVDQSYTVEMQEWLDLQYDMGHDYLKMSGGFLSVHGLDPTVCLCPEYAE